MRSMCRVLIKKTRLQCTTKTVNLHVRLTQIVLEQVRCRWSSDSEGATAVRVPSAATIQGVSKKKVAPKTFWNIFTSVKSFYVKISRKKT